MRKLKGVVKEINKTDGAQLVVTDAEENHLREIWMAGICRIPNASLNSLVELEYRSSRNSGLWFGKVIGV